MAFRRLTSIFKTLKLTPAYKPLPKIPINPGILDLKSSYKALSFTTMSQDHFTKVKLHHLKNLSMNMYTLPQGKEIFSDKVQGNDDNVRTENVEEDKRLMNIAINIQSEMVQTEEKLEEVEMMLEEIISELEGFVSFLKWDIREEKLNSIEDILNDVDCRSSKSFAALDKLLGSIDGRKSKGRDTQNTFEDILIDICSIKVREMKSLEQSKQTGKLLKEMVERRAQCRFYMLFLFGGR